MRVSVATVNFNSGRFTELLLKSLLCLNPAIRFKVAIFDNASDDGSLDFLKSHPHNIAILRGANPHTTPSASHAFAVDQLLTRTGNDFDYLLLVDTDCFCLNRDWLAALLGGNRHDVLGAPAYCPIVSEENRYLWPGFTIYRPNAVDLIRENDWSFMPQRDYSKPNDSGQALSELLHKSGLSIGYLPRTPPASVGAVAMEKWSIDGTIHHFFAASRVTGLKQFQYIYGDKTRGRYITKRLKAWRLFKQSEIRQLMAMHIGHS